MGAPSGARPGVDKSARRQQKLQEKLQQKFNEAISPAQARLLTRVTLCVTFALLLVFGVWISRPLWWGVRARLTHGFQPGLQAPGLVPARVAVAASRENLGKGSFLEQHMLSKERAQAVAKDGYIIVTWSNTAYTRFIHSWVEQLKKLKLSNYMVGAMDEPLLHTLVDEKINTWWLNSTITSKDLGWGSANFRLMGRIKVGLIYEFALMGINVVVSDVDVLWLRDPIPFFRRFPEPDILVSSDLLRNTVDGEELETHEGVHSTLNIGAILVRPKAVGFVKTWLAAVADPQMWDQAAFNQILREGLSAIKGSKGLHLGFHGEVKFGVLPVSLFCSGHTHFVQRMGPRLGHKPFAIHATFQYGGTRGKRQRFRDDMLFLDAPEYYKGTSPYVSKGYLTFSMDIPKHLLNQTFSSEQYKPTMRSELDGHFALVHFQLLRLRNALAIAQITGRALVMPKLWCGMDKYWAPLESGRIPGTKFPLPFQCPMDHIFDLESQNAIGKVLDKNVFGPDIHFRETTFLDNPRVPETITKSRVKVQICKSSKEANCADGSKPAEVKDGILRLQPNLTSSQVTTALTGAKAMVLDFNTMASAFGNFSDEQDWRRFTQRIKYYPAQFCCTLEHPGWTWYDFLWDLPHTDRFDRKFDKWVYKHGDRDRRLSA